MDPLYQIPVTTIKGESVTLTPYEDKVMLIVNTASKCGFTPQYKGLEELHERFKDRGLAVLGFPCDQFGHQEPGDESAISQFCELNYGVTFPLFAKINVNGADAHPLYNLLKERAPGILGTEAIKWNFTKFLVARHAAAITRFASATAPESLASEIEALL